MCGCVCVWCREVCMTKDLLCPNSAFYWKGMGFASRMLGAY